MDRESVIGVLRAHKAELEQLGVANLYLFGSVARNEADDKSDVDLLMTPTSEKFTLYDMIHVMDVCSEMLGVPADINDYRGLVRVPDFHGRIVADIVNVF